MNIIFRYLLMALCCYIITGSNKSQASALDIHVANRGDIPIYVAVMTYGGWFGVTKVEGWQKINPSQYLEPLVKAGSTRRTYYLTFAIKDKTGKFGYVNYSLLFLCDNASYGNFFCIRFIRNLSQPAAMCLVALH